jgi:hypothetical protein
MQPIVAPVLLNAGCWPVHRVAAWACWGDPPIVFTLPAEIGAIACQNKAIIYALLFKAASDTMLTIAADPKHLNPSRPGAPGRRHQPE